jgi:mRNA-degrading endonuclease RelE of RelBE toxin-antitoxin system
MSESYDIFIKQPVHENLKRLKGSKKRAIEKFIDYLSDNPFEAGDFSESDEIGRKIY